MSLFCFLKINKIDALFGYLMGSLSRYFMENLSFLFARMKLHIYVINAVNRMPTVIAIGYEWFLMSPAAKIDDLDLQTVAGWTLR